MFKIDILLLFYLQHGRIITKNLPLAPIYSSYFQEQNFSQKKHNLFNCYNGLSSICFSKIFNLFYPTFCHISYLQAAIISKDGINNA